jgi:hypothetical protein
MDPLIFLQSRLTPTLPVADRPHLDGKMVSVGEGHESNLLSGTCGRRISFVIAVTLADISVVKSARYFAAWHGLVLRQHFSGGKTRPGRITRTGNREIRKLRPWGHVEGERFLPQKPGKVIRQAR